MESSCKPNHNDGACEHDGDRIMSRGSSEFVSMYSKKGSKGVNQDAFTVWKVRFLMYMFAIWLHFLFPFQSIFLELLSLKSSRFEITF